MFLCLNVLSANKLSDLREVKICGVALFVIDNLITSNFIHRH